MKTTLVPAGTVDSAEIVAVTTLLAPGVSVTAEGTVEVKPATTGLAVTDHVKVDDPHVAASVFRRVSTTAA